MEILKVIGFALIALFIVIVFQTKNRNDIAVPISLATGILIFIFILPKLTVIINFLQVLSNKANIDVSYLNLVFKILGIAYLASFCSEICKDAGAGSIGSKVEFAGKILILTLSIPILMAVLDSILKIL